MGNSPHSHSYSIFIAYEYGTKDKEWFKFSKLIKSTEGVDIGSVSMDNRSLRYVDNEGLRTNHVDNISKDIQHNPFLRGKKKNQLVVKDGALLNRFRGRIMDQIFVSGKKKHATPEVSQLIDRLLHNDVIVWNDEIPDDVRVVFIDGDE